MKKKNLLLVFLILGILSLSFNSCKKDDNDKTDVTGITLNETSLILDKGSEYQLTVIKFSPDNATEKKISWSSGDETIVSVSNDGNATANSVGFTSITATAESGVTAVCSVAIYDGNEPQILKWKGITTGEITLNIPGHTLILVYNDNGEVISKMDNYDTPISFSVPDTGSIKATNPIQTDLSVDENTELTYLDCSNNSMQAIRFYKSVSTLICENCSNLNLVFVEGAVDISDVAECVLNTLQGITDIKIVINDIAYIYNGTEWVEYHP